MSKENPNHNEQIEAYRKNARPPYQPTDYTGLKLENGVAAQLQEQDLGEILTFESVGGKTRVQARLPEKGFDPETGKEYNIRVNMNYLIRGMVRASMDGNGALDENKTMELFDLMDEVTDSFEEPEKQKSAMGRLTEALGVPEQAREDFQNFLYANRQNRTEKNQPSIFNRNTAPIALMMQETRKMAAYQKLMAGGELSEEQKKKVDPEKWKQMIGDMKEEYENLAENYRLMAEMDPETETRILQPSDCAAFRGYTSAFIDQHNQWRARENKPPIRYGAQDYNFNVDAEGFPKQEEKDGKVRYFDEHHLLTIPVKVDGEEAVLTLENTAPPSGKMIERPAVERTGVGLFENEKAVREFHYGVNLGPADLKEAEAFSKFMAHADQPVSMAPDSWEAEAFHAREQAKGTNDPEKIADCFARHLFAQAMVESGDAAHRPAYEKKAMDEGVEKLKQGRGFVLAVQAHGAEAMRKALAAPDAQKASLEIFSPDKKTRYGLDEDVRRQLRELGESMKTEGRSSEWVKLRKELLDPQMKDTSHVFDAVEAYTKGRKSVRKTQAGRDSFDLAMTALALAAKHGDPVAKQRAQNLVDRVNKVRGAEDAKHKNHVTLEAYEQKKADAPQRSADKKKPS